MRNHVYVTWYGMRMIILVVLSIRTSHILFSLCSPLLFVPTEGLTCFHHQCGFSRGGSVEIQGPMYISTYVYIRMCVYEMCARTPEGLRRHIIRRDGRKRVARDAENYPQLSRAYAIHRVSVLVVVMMIVLVSLFMTNSTRI